jgi:peptidoglycan-N-acetylglucosamine deacetylase
MWFVIPAGRARFGAAAVAGVLVLGWLSGLGPVRRDEVQKRPVSVPSVPVKRQRPKQPPPDCRKVKCVALTFDDGPGPYTTRLLRMLRARHAKVTFFLIGGNIRGREDVVRAELADGHAIGDHTWSHPDLTKLPEKRIRDQLTRTLTAIARVTGRPTTLMRPPYGATGPGVARVTRRMHLVQVVWSVDTDDWRDRNAAIVAHRAVTRARRGDIILMHDIHPTTVQAVPDILRGLAKRGFTFVTVPELLARRHLKPGKVYLHGG